MANRKIILPQYGTVMKRGVLYYRTRIKDANGKLVAIYAKTPEELYNKETLALEQIENATFHRKTPTVAEYCEKWLLMQSVHVRATTLTDYTSKVRRHIIAELGDKRMGEVSLDDIQLALVPVSKKSASVYKSVVILYKSIFRAAMESRIIDHMWAWHVSLSAQYFSLLHCLLNSMQARERCSASKQIISYMAMNLLAQKKSCQQQLSHMLLHLQCH